MVAGLTIGLIAGGAVVLYGIFTFNRLVRLRNQVKNGWSQIDVQLKRRVDLIPNLVETVKGYAKHEKELLENVTKARTALMGAQTIDAKAKASNMITESLKSIFAVAENYPQLKANENFLQLQEELAGTENKIAYARQFYNDVVMSFNTALETFPSNIIAGMFSFKQESLFQVAEHEREPVKVKF